MYKSIQPPQSIEAVAADAILTVISAEDVVVLDDEVAEGTVAIDENYRNVDHRTYVTPSDEIVEGPSPIRRNKRWVERLTWPKYPTMFHYISLLIATMITLAIYAVTLYLFITKVVFDKKGDMKPFKGACFSADDMKEHFCFFSAGQVAFGIICLGQVNIGLICMGQVCVGLAFAVGQVAVGWGYCPIGQLTSGFYSHFAQIAFCLYNVEGAQLGFRTIRCFIDNENGEEKASVTC
jgi:hypothetical protein